jgi:hypothetical protein
MISFQVPILIMGIFGVEKNACAVDFIITTWVFGVGGFISTCLGMALKHCKICCLLHRTDLIGVQRMAAEPPPPAHAAVAIACKNPLALPTPPASAPTPEQRNSLRNSLLPLARSVRCGLRKMANSNHPHLPPSLPPPQVSSAAPASGVDCDEPQVCPSALCVEGLSVGCDC